MTEPNTILFINACVREESRTKRLADAFLSKTEGTVIERNVAETVFPTADEAFLRKRDRLIEERRFDDPLFDLAREFAAADRIVVAAPYWDLSFPAALKQYFEQINVLGVTFVYTPEGIPKGLCRAKELVYIMTAGGPFAPTDYGYGYVKALAELYYGIPETRLIQAAGLDIDGADPEAILRDAIESL